MMARYPLEPLLSARLFREEAAEREARLAGRRLEEARQTEAEAGERLRLHRERRPAAEERLFGEVKGKVMPQSGLDTYREKIAALRQTEIVLDDARLEAEKTVSVRTGELEEARRRQAAAARDRRKIDAHKDIWRREEALRLEKAEEAELEDFPARIETDETDGE